MSSNSPDGFRMSERPNSRSQARNSRRGNTIAEVGNWVPGVEAWQRTRNPFSTGMQLLFTTTYDAYVYTKPKDGISNERRKRRDRVPLVGLGLAADTLVNGAALMFALSAPEHPLTSLAVIGGIKLADQIVSRSMYEKLYHSFR